MSLLIAPQHLATAHLLLSALVLIWDLYIAGHTAKLRATPRTMASLTALAGLLLVPALMVLLLSNSLLSGRTLSAITWVWPATVMLIVAQAIYAVTRRLVAPAIGVPIAAYDLLLAVTYTTRYAISLGRPVSASLLALVAAQRGALAFSAQPLALLLPWYLYLPIFTPATPGRRGPGTVLRTMLAALAAAWAALVVIDIPAAMRAIGSYSRYATERLQERPDSDFTIGVKVFPTLTSGPPPLSLQADLALADSIGASALSVYIAPAGTTPTALDSLAHSLEDTRGDKELIVALDLSRERRLPRAARASYLQARVADVARIAQHLHPEYLVPVLDPNGVAARALGAVPLAFWTTYLRDATMAVHGIDPKLHVMAHVGGFGAADSALYAWAASPRSPVDAVSISLFPWLGGAATLDVRMRTAASWIRSAASPKEQWVLEAGGFPMSHGDASQARAIWGALAWATSESAIKGFIVYEASDYDAPLGLRAVGGRMRLAATTVRQAITVLGGN